MECGMNSPDYNQLARRLKLLAHPERLRILDALRPDSECVCHLRVLLGRPQPYVSQQLRLLREAGLIRQEKQGVHVFYHLAETDILPWLEHLLGPPGHQPAEKTRRQYLVACTCPKCQTTSATRCRATSEAVQ